MRDGLAYLGSLAADQSRLISGTYPPGLDPEAHLWRRVGKVAEEAGEAFEALLGMIGENPRKGVTATREDLVDELLDVALCALGAVEHVTGDGGTSVYRLLDHAERTHDRLAAAIAARA